MTLIILRSPFWHSWKVNSNFDKSLMMKKQKKSYLAQKLTKYDKRSLLLPFCFLLQFWQKFDDQETNKGLWPPWINHAWSKSTYSEIVWFHDSTVNRDMSVYRPDDKKGTTFYLNGGYTIYWRYKKVYPAWQSK